MTISLRPPFPLPLAADPDDQTFSGPDSPVRRLSGRHAPFCVINDDVPNPGQTVAVHGPMCLSESAISGVVARGADGRLGAFFGSLAEPYFHGVYHASDVEAADDAGQIRLEVDCPTSDGARMDAVMYIGPEEARVIAAGLYRLAADLESRRSEAAQ